MHFRMNGDWHLGGFGAEQPRYARVTLDLDDGTAVSLVDSRALATATLQPAGVPVASLGPDPTDPAFGAAALSRRLQGRRIAIKPALLDQRVVAGIGNIYAAEALWRARVDPRVIAGQLGPVRTARLATAIRDTLTEALDDAGRYQDGEAPERLAVYDREGAPCRRCAAPVRRLVQAGRSTYFCAGCQRR